MLKVSNIMRKNISFMALCDFHLLKKSKTSFKCDQGWLTAFSSRFVMVLLVKLSTLTYHVSTVY